MQPTDFIILALVLVALIIIYQRISWVTRFASVIEYIIQSVYLICDVILIWVRKHTDGRNVGGVNSNTRQTAISKDTTTKPLLYGNSIPIATVRGKPRRNTIKKHFVSTAPGRNHLQASQIQNSAVTEAVRENIVLIENDLKVVESSLLDELQDHISEEDVNRMKSCSRQDQAHLFAEIVEEYDEEMFLLILSILDKASFSHIAQKLKKSYMNYKPFLPRSSSCPVCRIQAEVDIKTIRSGLKSKDLLPHSLYKDINKANTGEGHQNVLWQALFYQLKLLKPKEEITTKFVNVFDIPKHKSLHSFLLKNNLHNYDCTCSKRPHLETDHFRPPISDSSEESNTSLRKPCQNPDWYEEAIYSSSSDPEHFTTGTAKSELVAVGCERRNQENVGMKHRYTSKQGPMNRLRNEHMIKNHVSLHNRTSSTESKTDVKVPYDEVDQRHKVEPESLSIQPYISDSDINSSGEARKDYIIPNHPKPRGNQKRSNRCDCSKCFCKDK